MDIVGAGAVAESNNRGPGSLLSVRDLTVKFGSFRAVNSVSFDVYDGETVAIVGESGSGKSVTALSVMRLVAFGGQAAITGGEIWFRLADGSRVDLIRQPESVLRTIRGHSISMIFQEPMTSLNPLYTIGNQLTEGLMLHQQLGRRQARARAARLLDRVRVPETDRLLGLYPHQLSGGMRQRVMIAMALSCRPRLLIADEPTSSIDVTVQAQILALINEVKREFGVSVLLITHDMGVVAENADRVVVMKEAQVVESASVYDIFEFPQHAYTEQLLAAVPRLGSMTGTSEPERFVSEWP